MAKKSMPIHVFPPMKTTPVRAGVFSWSDDYQVGEFVYDLGFLATSERVAMDPVALRLKRGTIKETRNSGIFGVFHDAGPDAWGRDLAYRIHGEMDAFDLLTKGPGDGIDNIVFGDEYPALSPLSLCELEEIAAGFPCDDLSVKLAMNQTTSMGGAKPKLLVEHDGAFWIAKFPEKGDPRRMLAANEHAMLSMAPDCGIDACDSLPHDLPDGRKILLVKRFDLQKTADGVTHCGYASAHSMLGMGNPREDGQRKSYLRFAEEARRWSGKDWNEAIWRRIVFNAMVGNVDDHPRNHAMIHDQNGWQLSKVFDIVASVRPHQIALDMRFHAGGAVATPKSLFESGVMLGLPPEFVATTIIEMGAIIETNWRSYFEVQNNIEPSEIDQIAGAFKLAEQVGTYDFGPLLTPTRKPKRYVKN